MRPNAALLFVALLAAAPVAARPPRPRREATPAKRLGAADAAFRAGDYARAYRLAASLEGAALVNGDYALHLAAESAYRRGQRSKALRLFERLADDRDSRFQEAARWRVADCRFALGRLEQARRDYERLLAGSKGGDRGTALYRIGLAEARRKRPREARRAWRRLVLEHPAHALAPRALARLRQAGAPLGPEERIARARELLAARRWRESLRELEAIKGRRVPDEIRIRRDYWIAQSLFRTRHDYVRAAELFLSLYAKAGKDAPEALFKGARALSRADQDSRAITWYHKLVDEYPRTAYADQALFLAGWLELNREQPLKALPDLLRHRERYPRSRFARERTWYLGFAYHLLGEHAKALGFFDELARGDQALVGGKGAYWRARTLEALGRRDEATAALRQLVGRFPFTWYSILARARLGERGIAVGPFGDAPPAAGGAPTLGSIDPRLTREPGIRRADELIAAGMAADAAEELRRAERALLGRYGSARALPVLLDRYREAGSYSRPRALAAASDGDALARPPEGPARPWWERAYPLAYRAYVERYGKRARCPTYWLYAIMRKESGFDPGVVSYANAVGLMQMIPATARRVMRALGMKYRDELLLDPERNIKVAAWYLGRLFHKFKGQIPLAAGAYNGGPRPMMRFVDRYGDRPLDELVEMISYHQSREYAKKVTGIYARYRYLYDGKPYDQPLTVDRQYVKDEITY